MFHHNLVKSGIAVIMEKGRLVVYGPKRKVMKGVHALKLLDTYPRFDCSVLKCWHAITGIYDICFQKKGYLTKSPGFFFFFLLFSGEEERERGNEKSVEDEKEGRRRRKRRDDPRCRNALWTKEFL
jgi:hypothetical protein